ncbi:permease-like cell division protein FtsX [Kutzneria viridogrisea]|uniref:Cell division protein FtsX n=2 Tax=Kutzneria TaxID=43356 RepID=W5W0X5_9PSEU|nr:permease-like cell division protein FtsX [Kutzneria albida]AHH94492.1 Cell division ftsX-like protein [Kutzneria albida DSM 43870]MBA8930159.1 cell division transport system permease protein [Kutzneria viridogrisea]
MRASFVFSEVITGLRRNITMTVAMILTTAISLGLLGGGLLVVRMIDKMQLVYSDKVQVVVSLTDDISANDKSCSSALCTKLLHDLQGAANVEGVTFENRDHTFERFKQLFAANPELVKLTRPESLPASLQVKLVDSSKSDALVKAFSNQPGVKNVNDQNAFLQKIFSALGQFRFIVFGIAVAVAVAAVLLIFNTIQLSAFTRRTEVGIMRLVGATRWYTQLPFLIEAVVAGIIGSLLGIILLAVLKVTLFDQVLGGLASSSVLPRLDMLDVVAISPVLVLVAAVISAITGYVTLRLYVRL